MPSHIHSLIPGQSLLKTQILTSADGHFGASFDEYGRFQIVDNAYEQVRYFKLSKLSIFNVMQNHYQIDNEQNIPESFETFE